MSNNYAYGLRLKKTTNGKETFVEIIPPIPTEEIRGGFIASARTNEETEVVIDTETGKAYVGSPWADEDIIETLAECDMLTAVADADGSYLADENSNVFAM